MKKILVILTVIASFVLCSCEPPVSVPNSIGGGSNNGGNNPPINNVYNIEIVVMNASGNTITLNKTNKDNDYSPMEVKIFEKDENGVIINDEVTVYTPKSNYKKIICKNYTENTRIEVEYDISYKFVPCEKKLNDIVEHLDTFYNEAGPTIKILDKKFNQVSNPNLYIINIQYNTGSSSHDPYSVLPQLTSESIQFNISKFGTELDKMKYNVTFDDGKDGSTQYTQFIINKISKGEK